MKHKLLLKNYVPAGIDLHQEIKWIGTGLFFSFLYSLGFFIAFFNRRQELFIHQGQTIILNPNAVMPDFVDLLGGKLTGFLIVGLCMIGLLLYHYLYHYSGSKSIYLMRRLPARWELFKRCVTLPLVAFAAALLLAVLLLLIYFAIYLLLTPKACLAPHQWDKIWQLSFGIFS